MDKQIIGACGEHYVSAYLSGHELLVALPRAGVKVSDLFVAHPETGYPLRVQVKTGTDSKRKDKGRDFYEWQMKCPADKYCNDSSWFAFVWLRKWPSAPEPPEMFIVPSLVVSARIKEECGAKSSWSSFWMWASDLEQYKEGRGVELMKQSMFVPRKDEQDC